MVTMSYQDKTVLQIAYLAKNVISIFTVSIINDNYIFSILIITIIILTI